MSVRFDWYKHDPQAFLIGVQGMGPDVIGAYIVILDLIYARGGEMRRDDHHLSGILGCSKRLAKSLTDRLIEAGKISFDGELLTNFRAETELNAQRMVSERRSNAQRVRRENEAKSNENNDIVDKRISLKPYREEERREEDISSLRSLISSEPENPPPSRVAIELKAIKGKVVKITFDEARKWQQDFPAVDVRQELREMRSWLDANPSKRKTETGMRRFVVNWLSKEQDKGGPSRSPQASRPKVETAFDALADVLRMKGLDDGSEGDHGNYENGSCLPSATGEGHSGPVVDLRPGDYRNSGSGDN